MIVWQALQHLTRLYWVASVLGAVAAMAVPFVGTLVRYGKARQVNHRGLDSLTVPKSLFATFYVVGSALTVALLVVSADPRHLVLVVFLLHALRRLYEELTAPPSEAQMHLVGLLVGISFYLFAPVTLFAPWQLWHDESASFRAPPELHPLQLLFGLALICLGSVHQYRCHLILRKLKAKPGDAYGLPKGDWFSLVSSPHYLAEICIYVGLAVLAPSLESALMLGFVVCNLCVTGAATHAYYQKMFKHAFVTRYAVLPYVW
jgi:hypothetical protein